MIDPFALQQPYRDVPPLVNPASLPIVTCDHLAAEGKWNEALCCARCHTPEAFRRADDPRWLPTPGLVAVTLTDSRLAELCCSAALTVKSGATS